MMKIILDLEDTEINKDDKLFLTLAYVNRSI